MITLRVTATIEIVIDVAGFESTIDSTDVSQAVQNEIGHTGAIVVDVVEWQEDTE